MYAKEYLCEHHIKNMIITPVCYFVVFNVTTMVKMYMYYYIICIILHILPKRQLEKQCHCSLTRQEQDKLQII